MPQCWIHKINELRNWWISTKEPISNSYLHIVVEIVEAQWPIGYGVGLRIKRSSVRIRPWPLRWVLGQGSLLPLSQGEAFTLASISCLAILVKYKLAKKKRYESGEIQHLPFKNRGSCRMRKEQNLFPVISHHLVTPLSNLHIRHGMFWEGTSVCKNWITQSHFLLFASCREEHSRWSSSGKESSWRRRRSCKYISILTDISGIHMTKTVHFFFKQYSVSTQKNISSALTKQGSKSQPERVLNMQS